MGTLLAYKWLTPSMRPTYPSHIFLMSPTGQTGFHWGLKWTGARGAERDNDHLSFNAFPVKLCFAMTINKSQGQSFKTIGVDLQDQVFTHGQFYVAMSRVTDVNNISILRVPDENGQGEKLLNIVFPEVLIR